MTLHEIRIKIRQYEDHARDQLAPALPGFADGLDVGYRLATLVARQTVIELDIKGILPEGARIRPLLVALGSDLEASKQRVLGNDRPPLPGYSPPTTTRE